MLPRGDGRTSLSTSSTPARSRCGVAPCRQQASESGARRSGEAPCGSCSCDWCALLYFFLFLCVCVSHPVPRGPTFVPVQRSYGISVDEWSDQPLVPAEQLLTTLSNSRLFAFMVVSCYSPNPFFQLSRADVCHRRFVSCRCAQTILETPSIIWTLHLAVEPFLSTW